MLGLRSLFPIFISECGFGGAFNRLPSTRLNSGSFVGLDFAMPPVIGISSFHISEHTRATVEFDMAFGRAFGQWALIEERLFYWFHYATGLPGDLARIIYYSHRTFQGRSLMLENVLETRPLKVPGAQEFIVAAIKKAVQFNGFRNKLAHGDPTFDVRGGSPTFKQVILLQARHGIYEAAETAVTMAQLGTATNNFRELARLIMDVFDFLNSGVEPDKPAECLKQVLALPDRAEEATRAPKKPKPPRPPKPSRASRRKDAMKRRGDS